MGGFDNFMKKLGFVKLDRYGLVLTPDDRIMATRPAVLDDGIGGRIVGWTAEDLAASELQPWVPGTVQQRREILMIVPRMPVPVSTPAPAPLPIFAPEPAPVSARTPVPAPVAKPVEPVAPAAPVEEDEWEWEIAVARARAEAADAEAAAKDEDDDESWAMPTTAEPLPASSPSFLAPVPVARPQRVTSQPIGTPSTVIPVPKLPAVSDPSLVRASLPAARPYTPPPRRYPKATGAPATSIGQPASRRAAAKHR